MSGDRAARVAVALVAAATLCFTTTRGLVADGSRALKAGKAKEAVAAYKRALERSPGEPAILFDLGLAEAQAGDPAGGRDHLQAALTAGGESLRGAIDYNVGNTYLTEKQWSEAANAFEAALRADPANRDAKANLELARRKLKEAQEKKKKEQQKQKKKGDKKKGDQKKKGKQGDKGDKKKPEEGKKKEEKKEKGKDKPGEEKKRQGDKGQKGAPEKKPPAGQQEKKKQKGHPGKEGEKGGAPKPPPAAQPPQAQGGAGQKKGGMDPAQAAQLLKALQRQEGEIQRQVRARLVPVAPRQRAQDW